MLQIQTETYHSSTAAQVAMDKRKFNRWNGYNRRIIGVGCHKAVGNRQWHKPTDEEQKQHRKLLDAVQISEQRLYKLVHRGPS
eukprot:SAG11_NODE_84_length_17377_cov_78.572578_5_plen_83_part_00